MFDGEAGDARRSVARIDGENGIFIRRGLVRSATGPTRTTGNIGGTRSAKALHKESRSIYETARYWKVKKEIPVIKHDRYNCLLLAESHRDAPAL